MRSRRGKPKVKTAAAAAAAKGKGEEDVVAEKVVKAMPT
jgi:hypothetical protein